MIAELFPLRRRDIFVWRHICLSEDQISESVLKNSGSDDQMVFKGTLERLITNGILVKDTERPIPFYRLTFLGTLAAAEAKRETIRRSRSRNEATAYAAQGTAKSGLPAPSGRNDPLARSREEKRRRAEFASDIAKLHPNITFLDAEQG